MAVDLPPSPPEPQKTNTVIITSLTPPFFHPQVQAALRAHFEHFGPIHNWAPLRSFGRIIVVYWDEEGAEGAKSLDGSPIGDDHTIHMVLRVFRALPTPIVDPEDHTSNHLMPPELEKNFLISPPGSPPIGWEQIQEEPPNSAPLASDLLAALERLQMNHGTGHREDGREELVRAEEVDGGIGIWVEDVEKINSAEGTPTDDPAEGDWYEGPPTRIMPPRTARPPMVG